MKRKIVTAVLLAAVLVLLLAVPAAATPPKATSVTFTYTTIDTWTWTERVTGATTHWYIIMAGDFEGDDERLDQSSYYFDLKCSSRPNPNPNPYDGWWGSCQNTFTITAAPEVAPESGFKGTCNCLPWTLSDKFPRGGMTHCNSLGFGQFEGLHLQFDGDFWTMPYTGSIW